MFFFKLRKVSNYIPFLLSINIYARLTVQFYISFFTDKQKLQRANCRKGTLLFSVHSKVSCGKVCRS